MWKQSCYAIVINYGPNKEQLLVGKKLVFLSEMAIDHKLARSYRICVG